ncbi:flagellar hook protein FlgE [Sansalvadorimonas sp. 2012CJ34-2]|uniref:Flagellar hook protein FlgE n=1 Tax=Parendozoicomonas callyspongiae TaxID=2942213 RepID=A0ABT0PHZ1_9GAMM|nr:flagellar hook protein FlgE [Sansalvadorimonas sp. 2012CJ34-2]MCL6270103.1 flagellar hook protein FlgE [Sansalvadorimonas sp. 2012CJ34-2]
MPALNNGISGLNAASSKLDAISNNIANANTTGFKSKNVQFADVFSSTGIGGGVYVSDVSTDYAQGALNSTSSVLDMAIQGNGFFITSDASGNTTYTRAGNFEIDKDGNVVNSQGLNVKGYGVDGNGNPITGSLKELNIDTSDKAAKASSVATLKANLDARAKAVTVSPLDPSNKNTYTSTTSTIAYDSQGVAHTVTSYYIKKDSPANTWEVHYRADNGASDIATATLTFDANGKLTSTAPSPISVAVPAGGAGTLNLKMDLTGITQYGSDFNVNTNKADGYAPGSYTGITISDKGEIFATYSNGQTKLQGVVAIATFPNQGALADAGNTSWKATIESGDPITHIPGEGSAGSIKSKSLENSNVDSTAELVDMVVAQSSYQANAKTISASNQMTQTLINAI